MSGSETGLALFMTMMFIFIITLIAFTLSGIALVNLKLNANLMQYKKAVYAAEAGSQYTEAVINDVEEDLPEKIDVLELANGSKFSVEIQKDKNNSRYFLISRGKYKESTSIFKIDKEIN